VRSQTEHLQNFLEDVGACGKGLLQLLDSTLRQEQLQVPPDTAVPKKHMTLKKLRKAQRIREQVSQGGEDRSQVRVWDGIDVVLTATAEVVRASEDLVLDLGQLPRDTAVTTLAPPAGAAVGGADNKKDAKKEKAPPAAGKNAPPAAEPAAAAPALIPPSWAAVLKEKTAAKGQVSTAHRIVVNERDAAVALFTQYLAGTFEDVRGDYDTVLRQEASWNERWRRQVEMLRHGDL
jgi:hypothetical protein